MSRALTRTNLLLESGKVQQLRKTLHSRSNSEAVRRVIEERLAVEAGLGALRALRELGGLEDIFGRCFSEKEMSSLPADCSFSIRAFTSGLAEEKNNSGWAKMLRAVVLGRLSAARSIAFRVLFQVAKLRTWVRFLSPLIENHRARLLRIIS